MGEILGKIFGKPGSSDPEFGWGELWKEGDTGGNRGEQGCAGCTRCTGCTGWDLQMTTDAGTELLAELAQ